MLIVVIPTGLGVRWLCWSVENWSEPIVVAASRCGASSRVLEWLRALAQLVGGPGSRASPAYDVSYCSTSGRSGQLGGKRVRRRHLGAPRG